MFRDPGIDLTTKSIVEQMGLMALNKPVHQIGNSDPFLQPDKSSETTSGRLSVVDSLKSIYDNVFENDNDTDLPEYSRIESLPLPPFERICYYLYTDGDCKDLSNLSKASPLFHHGVKKFMSRENNRPAMKYVHFGKKNYNLNVSMYLFPSNLPFHNLDKLDWSRFKLEKSSCGMSVTLRGPDDPIIDQVIRLLSVRIWTVEVGLWRSLSMADLSLVERLIRASAINSFCIWNDWINDTTAPLISSIVAHVTQYAKISTEQTLLSDPASFIAQLYSSSCFTIRLVYNCYSPFFGLSHSYRVNFLNEMLLTGSVEYIEVGNKLGRITTAPIDLPDNHMRYVEWKKAAK